MKSNSTNAKYFKFNEKADYIFYLAELITDLIQKKDRLERYGNEIKLVLKDNSNAKFIQSEIYESISDKVNRVFQYLFNLIGDESKKAVSYRKYRKILYRAKNSLKITINQLPQKEAEILGEFNQLRNWGLHIPESLFLQKKVFFKMDSDFILTNKKIIPIPTYDYFEIKFLTEMGREVKEVLDASNLILERMKNDYSILIGETLKIEYEKNQVKPYIFMSAVQNSWDVQKGKLT
ncbi:MAG: hypothetical protein GY828_06610 [Candidatus Gracilibacteria bacterium]|nr:hypothetical protein [Candidatus Gracilibacteria bacterium]